MKWQNVRKMWADPRSCCWCPDSSALILRTSETVWNSFHLPLTSRSHTWIHPKQKHQYVPTRLCPGSTRRGRQGERDVMHRAHQNIRTWCVTKVHLCNFNFLQFLFGCRERCWGRAGGHVSQVSLETDVVLGGRQTPSESLLSSKTSANWPSCGKDFTHFARTEHFVLDVTASKLFLQCGTRCCIHHFLPHLLAPSWTGGWNEFTNKCFL